MSARRSSRSHAGRTRPRATRSCHVAERASAANGSQRARPPAPPALTTSRRVMVIGAVPPGQPSTGAAGRVYTLRGLITRVIASPMSVPGALPADGTSVLIRATIVVFVRGRYSASVW